MSNNEQTHHTGMYRYHTGIYIFVTVIKEVNNLTAVEDRTEVVGEREHLK